MSGNVKAKLGNPPSEVRVLEHARKLRDEWRARTDRELSPRNVHINKLPGEPAPEESGDNGVRVEDGPHCRLSLLACPGNGPAEIRARDRLS